MRDIMDPFQNVYFKRLKVGNYYYYIFSNKTQVIFLFLTFGSDE